MIEVLQQDQAFGRNSCLYDAAIVFLALAGD
jgi:hypothetical protein